MSAAFENKRGLIYAAFSDLLGEAQASSAVAFWDTWNPSNQASFTPLRFVQAVQAEVSLTSDLKRQLVKRMVGYKAHDEAPHETVKPTPASRVQAGVTGLNTSFSIDSAQYIVFTALLYPLFTRLRLSERQFLATLHPEARSDVKSLLDGSSPMRRNPERVMRNCLDHLYELLCDEFGPVKTDQIIARALNQAEALPEADLFAPRQLF